MNFLYPSFLFGLAAVAIPVAIHLFNFRQTRKVYFTNVAFLKDVNTATSSFRRLRHLLILLSRILFIVFLVLAFAQPFIPNRNNQATNSATGLTSIYIDNSLSMQNEADRVQGVDRALQQTEKLLSLLPNTPSYLVLTNDFESRDQLVVSPDKLKDRLTEIGLSNTSRTLASVQQRQASLLDKHAQSPHNQVFWFSDFQKSTGGALNAIKLDTLNQYSLVPVQAQEAANVYVDSLWLTTPFVKSSESNELNVRLVNTGNKRVENLPVKLFLDEKQVSAATAAVAAGSNAVATFNFTVQTDGFKRGRISFEDFPVTFDNEYYFVLNASPIINVVHLYQGNHPAFITSVFGNESAFSVKSFSVTNADLAQIKTADLVVMDGVTGVDATLRQLLETFVKDGGSLLLFPDAQVNPASYVQLLGALDVRNVQAVAAQAAVPEEVNNPANVLAPPDTKNPFFESIFENTTQKGVVNMPFARPVLRWGNSGTALLKFKNDQPFLSQFAAGQGKVYVAAAPLDLVYTNFPKHALFVPILYRIAALSKSQERLAYSFQEPTIAVRVNAATGSEQIYKLKKGNFEVIPAQRKNGSQLIVELPQTNQTSSNQIPESGYYELTLNGKTERLLAFNYDKKESQLAAYSPTELKQAFAGKKNVQVFNSVKDSDNFVNEFTEQNVGKNLWKYCLIAALACLLAEIALIRLMA